MIIQPENHSSSSSTSTTTTGRGYVINHRKAEVTPRIKLINAIVNGVSRVWCTRLEIFGRLPLRKPFISSGSTIISATGGQV